MKTELSHVREKWNWDRFSAHVSLGDGCWEWIGRRGRGYGLGCVRLTPGKWQNNFAHKISYMIFRGEIPEGKQLDHLCRNRACVRPDHLEPVSAKENVLRGIGVTAMNAQKTFCKNGHEFNEANTYFRPTGGRSCRVCSRLNMARYDKEARLCR